MTETAPEGCSVEHVDGTTTIRWGADRMVKNLAARRAVLCALVLGFFYVKGIDSLLLILLGVVLLGTLYQLLAHHVNRMTIRANDREWIFRRGPLPTLDPDFGWTNREKSIDPTRFYQVTSSAVVEEKGRYRWTSARSRSITELLVTLPLDLAFRHRHETRSPRITYDLWMKTRRGWPKVLSRLNGEQAEYLVQVLQPLLPEVESAPARADAPSRGLWWLRDGKGRDLPGRPEVQPMTAAPRSVAVLEDEGASATLQVSAEQSPIICTECDASNPVESAFCGECGALLTARAA